MSRILILGALPESLLIFRAPLIDSLKAAGHEVITAAAPAPAPLMDRLRERGISFFPVRMQRTGTNPFADLITALDCYRLFRRFKPDLVLCYTAKPVIYGLLAAAIACVPRMAAMIEGLGFVFTGRSFKHRVLGALMRGLYRMSLSRCSTVFFLNPDDQAYFHEQGLISEKTVQIRLDGIGVDLDHFSPAPLLPSPSFLLVARLLRDKGVVEYAEAARRVKARFPGARFRLAGWLDENPSCINKELLDGWIRDGIIEFLGRLDDVRPAYEGCSVYVLPSYREGMPVTIMEAMATGRAIIATDVPGCRETVVEGVNGLLVPARNVEALTEAMLRFIENPHLSQSMGMASRRMAEERFDSRRINRQIMAALDGF